MLWRVLPNLLSRGQRQRYGRLRLHLAPRNLAELFTEAFEQTRAIFPVVQRGAIKRRDSLFGKIRIM